MKSNIKTHKKKFDKYGFTVVKNFFSKIECEKAVIWLKKQNHKKLCKSWTEKEPFVQLAVYYAIHNYKTPISKLAKDRRLLKFAGDLINNDVYIWSSKVNLKSAWYGTAEYYHQDMIYWKDRGYKKNEMLSAMIILEPHKKENSALHVFPGTHKKGLIDHEVFTNINGLAKFSINSKNLNKIYSEHGLKAIEANPGDVVFFHASLVHGSSHNISNKSRMIILSQLNSVKNKPKNVTQSSIKFNLNRAKIELIEAKRKFLWYRSKYKKQKKSSKITFSAPIVKEEL